MARYVVLLNWTEQGVKNYKDTISRANAARQAFEKKGARITDFVWTLGPYDLVLMAEAPDDETITALSIGVSSLGNVKTLTMRAFDEADMRKVLQKV
jgi:uncharacterized protein with GYD domain